jgi:hypothetical protein
VVLRGLRQRPELNGRFGHVLDVVNANTADAKRWVWSHGMGAHGMFGCHQDASEMYL